MLPFHTLRQPPFAHVCDRKKPKANQVICYDVKMAVHVTLWFGRMDAMVLGPEEATGRLRFLKLRRELADMEFFFNSW